MISESASELSSMSPSPPTTKLTKFANKIKEPGKTTKMGHGQLEDHQRRDKIDHSVSTSHSNAKKKCKSKVFLDKHNDDDNDDDDDDDIDDDGDHDHDRGNTKHKKSIDEFYNDHQPGRSRNINKSGHVKSETNQHQKESNNLGQTISHKNKCPNDNAISMSTPSSFKKIKREKKRYQELVIDGFTITAFRTWEDLQEEINERISESIKRNAQYNDSEMPNTSYSNGTTSSFTATESLLNLNQSNTTATTSTSPPQTQQIRQTHSSSGATSSNSTSAGVQRNFTGNPDNPNLQDHRHHPSGINTDDHHRNKTMYNYRDQRVEYNDRQSLLHKTLRQNNEHERRQVNHDKSHHRGDYHKLEMQSTRDPSGSESSQHQVNSSVNSNHLFSNDSIYEQYRSGRLNDTDAKRSIKPQLETMRDTQAFQSVSVNNYPRRSPSPTRPSPLSSSQTAQQYFQQYHQLYQQMQNSAQQQNHQPPPPPPPPPIPNLQNPYFALINQPQSAQFKGHAHPPPTQPPHPPQPQMPMPNPSSMMAPYHYQSPYTITDTIISRQTSIIPSTPLPALPGSLEHLTSRYGRHPHLSALEHPMMPPTFGQHQQSSGYLPSPTERSFMEFARSYANATNMSSSYANFMNQAAIPKSSIGAPGFYNQIERVAMDQQHRAMIQSFGSAGPGSFPGFNPVNRPPISMFPPHFFP